MLPSQLISMENAWLCSSINIMQKHIAYRQPCRGDRTPMKKEFAPEETEAGFSPIEGNRALPSQKVPSNKPVGGTRETEVTPAPQRCSWAAQRSTARAAPPRAQPARPAGERGRETEGAANATSSHAASSRESRAALATAGRCGHGGGRGGGGGGFWGVGLPAEYPSAPPRGAPLAWGGRAAGFSVPSVPLCPQLRTRGGSLPRGAGRKERRKMLQDSAGKGERAVVAVLRHPDRASG